MSRLGTTTGDAVLAARAIAIGMLSNTVLACPSPAAFLCGGRRARLRRRQDCSVVMAV